MAKFWDNVSGPWKVFLLMGGFVLLIATIAISPDAFQRLADTAEDLIGTFMQLFQGE